MFDDLLGISNALGTYWMRSLCWLTVYGIAFIIMERLATAAEDGQPAFRRGFLTDIIHSLINPVVAFPVATMVLGAVHSASYDVHQVAAAWLQTVPFWLQLFLAIFVSDFIGYWRHRLLHLHFAWPFHAVHHSSEEMDWLSNDRVDIGENIVTHVCASAGLFALGFSPEVVFIELLIRRTYGIYLHCNITWSYGPLDYVFASPRFHRWHHSSEDRAIDRNFAVFFSCFDWVFGTYFMPENEFPHRVGLANGKMPDGYGNQVAYPFRTLWKRAQDMAGVQK